MHGFRKSVLKKHETELSDGYNKKAMTSFREITCTCPLCAQTFSAFALSTASSGRTFDLDFRPHGPQRAAIGAGLFPCPECGYVMRNKDHRITDPQLQKRLQQMIRSEDYMHPLLGTIEGRGKACMQRAYIEDLIHPGNGYEYYLQAVWAADDADGQKSAAALRELALLSLARKQTLSEEEELIRIDLLRRTGQFEEARAHCRKEGKSPLFSLIAAVQMRLLEKKDESCHAFAETDAELTEKNLSL